MATERRKRINLYVGPKETVSREELSRMDASGEWVFEEKKDGFWCLAVVRDGAIAEMVSRTGLAFEGAEVAGLLGLPVGSGSGRVVGELTADSVDGERCGTRRVHLFDVLDWNGLDLRDLSQVERREALEMIFGTFAPPVVGVVRLVEQRATGAVTWLDEILSRGGEGVVAKRKDAKCRAVNGDGKIDAWRRCKPKRTVDYVVIGPDGTAEKGTPKIALGLYKQTKDGRRVVKCMSPTWPAGMDLRPGMVVEVEGAEVFPSGAVRHGHVMRVRGDKMATDCTIEAAVRS